MSTVAEIKAAFEQLPETEAWKLADWIQEFMEAHWDRQIEADAKAGRLDKFIDEALDDLHQGRTTPFP